MSGNINCGNFESGGKTRVNQQPGGNSTFSLGWGNEPPVQRNNYPQNKQRDTSQGHMQSYGREQQYQAPKNIIQMNQNQYQLPQQNAYNNFEAGDSIDSMVNLMNIYKQGTPNPLQQYQQQTPMNYQNKDYSNNNYDNFSQNKYSFTKPPKPSYQQYQQEKQVQFQPQPQYISQMNQPQQNQFQGNQNKGINHPQAGFSNGYRVAQPPGGRSNITFG